MASSSTSRQLTPPGSGGPETTIDLYHSLWVTNETRRELLIDLGIPSPWAMRTATGGVIGSAGPLPTEPSNVRLTRL